MFKNYVPPQHCQFDDIEHFIEGYKGNTEEVVFKHGSRYAISIKWLKRHFPNWNKKFHFGGEVTLNKFNQVGRPGYIDSYQWLTRYQCIDELNTFQLKLLYTLNWITNRIRNVFYDVCAMLMTLCPDRYYFPNIEYETYDDYIQGKRKSLTAPVEIPELEEEKTEEVLISYTPRKVSPQIPPSDEKVSQDKDTISNLNKLFWKGI